MGEAKTDLSIIIPFLNEEETLPQVVQEMNRFVATAFEGLRVEVIFVDDGSTDRSVEVLAQGKFQGYQAHLIRLSKNFGSHAALRAGIRQAQAPVTTFLTADLQDPPELVLQLYRKMKEGYETVWATRASLPTGVFERSFSKLYAWLVRRFAVSSFPENGFDIVMFGPKVREELNSNIESNSSIFLQILDLGFKQGWVSYHRRVRKAGRSKWTVTKKIKLLLDSFVAFSYAPIRAVSVIGIGLALAGFSWLLVVAYHAFVLKDLAPGWPTLIGVLLVGFGITNVSLGIIAEYLWRTLDAARQRKVFVVQEMRTLSQ